MKKQTTQKQTNIINVQNVNLSKDGKWLKIHIGNRNMILLHMNFLNAVLKTKKSKKEQ